MIAVDVSGSMDREEFVLQRRGYSEAIRHPNFIAAIRAGPNQRIAVTYVEWSGTRQQKVIVPWRVIDGVETAEIFTAELDRQPLVIARGTSISAAVTFSAELFQANAYESERQVIDVSGDGPNNYGPPILEARDGVVESGIVINGLPILIRPSPLTPDIVRYYSDCVIGGPGSFVLPVRRVAEFALAIRRKLILELVGASHHRIIPVQASRACRLPDRREDAGALRRPVSARASTTRRRGQSLPEEFDIRQISWNSRRV